MFILFKVERSIVLVRNTKKSHQKVLSVLSAHKVSHFLMTPGSECVPRILVLEVVLYVQGINYLLLGMSRQLYFIYVCLELTAIPAD